MKNLFCAILSILTFSVCFVLPNDIAAQENPSSTEAFLKSFEYRCIGPNRGGRVTAVAGTAAEPSTFYMGSTGGGVWKTEDFGINWKNISDPYFKSPSIGAIRVAPSNSQVVYVGTGSDGLRSNVITGKGMYKSINGGKNWTSIGLEKTGHIGAVEIHPEHADTVFVAAIGQAFQANQERGVFRTYDGGKNWDQVLFIEDTVGVADIEFCPNNSKILYAAAWRAERKPWTIISGGLNGGIYKTEDGGDSWRKLENGLPNGLIGKIDLAVSAAAPEKVYALVEAPLGAGGVYLSEDYGESFKLISTKERLLDRPFYYCNIDADPTNAEILYVSATQFWKSTNGGKTWIRRSTPHGDNHDIWINPNKPEIFVQANDGGANVTLNGGKSWSTQRNQPTAELYQVEVDDQYPYKVYAGQQDNSTISLPTVPARYAPSGASGMWEAIGGCETGPAVPKPGNPDIVYSNCKGRFGVYNRKTGQEKQYYVGATNIYGHNPKDLKFRFQRVSPIHVSPHNPDVVYHASQYLHKTLDDGEHWEIISPDLTAFEAETQVISGSPITRDITGEEFYSTIYSVRESKLKEGLIWVGANDGPVHLTQNGGRDWKNVTPKDLPPRGRVDCVEPSVHSEGKAYFTVLRYQLGDWQPYIYKTENYGKSWERLTNGNNGIPNDYPVRVVREDPDKEGLLYAGTEFGMFISFDDGANWIPFQLNLPITPITDIKVHRKDLVISTMGRSFWVLDNLSPLHQYSTSLTTSRVHLFKPEDTYHMRYRGTSKNSIPYYPSPAVEIDYYLKEDAKGPVTLDIMIGGSVIRSFSSEKPKRDSVNREVDMATGFYFKGYSPNLKTKAGFHRFRWDMRHQGIWDKDIARSGRSGPMACPGQYKVRLTVGEESIRHDFNLLMNPNIEQTGLTQIDLGLQVQLSLKIRDLRSRAKKLLNNVQVRKLDIENSIKRAKEVTLLSKQQMDLLSSIEKELETQEGRYMRPMLLDQLRYLASMLDRADQKPGQDAYDRFQELEGWFKALKLEFEMM